MTDGTWTCGDCGTEWPMTLNYCWQWGLDAAHLNLWADGYRTATHRWREFPIYLAVARDLNIEPPRIGERNRHGRLIGAMAA